jgi:transcriptional regulator with XRE-family HTH domain
MANPSTGRPEKPVSGDHPGTVAVALVLRDLRHVSGLTLRELAGCINYSVATLSAAASGKTLPRWEVVEAYARGCNAPAELMAELQGHWAQASADLNKRGTLTSRPPPRQSRTRIAARTSAGRPA